MNTFTPGYSTLHTWDPDAPTGTPHGACGEIVCLICGSVHPAHPDTAHAPVWALPDGTEPSATDYQISAGR